MPAPTTNPATRNNLAVRRSHARVRVERLECRTMLSATALGAEDFSSAFAQAAIDGLPTVEAAPALAEGAPTATPLASTGGFFHTSGNQILNSANQPVKIAGVSWFGFETNTFVPHGLWARNYKSMMDQMVAEGFNTIRLPYSNQLFDAGSTPNSINTSLNPDLVGLSGIQIMDKIVDYAGQIGLRIMLDHHRSDAGAGAQESGLWYTSAYPESRWISDWTMLATRYAGNSTIIGADIHNEPHGPANWGAGGTQDWRLAAERAGNAILAVNPDWLIVVEGVESASSGYYWWGGNLSNAGAFPVRLDVPGRLVYSPHSYPASVYPQSWFSAPNYPDNLPSVWDANWGYLFREGTAPILLGEFGTKLQTTSDQLWFDKIVDYLGGDLDGDGDSDLAPGSLGMSWTYWCWNPNSSDTGGILQDNWTTVHTAKVDELQRIQFAFPALSASTVVGRRLFYNQSGTASPLRYDGNNAAINANDDLAIATDKTAYLPGSGAATFANVSSYTKGINGIMIDLAGPHGAITASDFTFRVANNNTPNSWAAAPPPASISVRAGAGISGSDRVTITWANGAIQKKWLEVIVLANANTGLAQKAGYPAGQGDVFFFGHALADSGQGDTATQATVNSTDELAARNNPTTLASNIPITNLFDFNRDGQVNVSDALAARNHPTSSGNVTRFISIANPPAIPEAFPASDDAVASGLASPEASDALVAVGVPRWLIDRQPTRDLNSGPLARYFEHLAQRQTPAARKTLLAADRVANQLGLDDAVLDSLLAHWELE